MIEIKFIKGTKEVNARQVARRNDRTVKNYI